VRTDHIAIPMLGAASSLIGKARRVQECSPRGARALPASRLLPRLGRKIPKSLTDIFRIWHGDAIPNDPIRLYLLRRFAGKGTEAARQDFRL
jgi:hypothetical protein